MSCVISSVFQLMGQVMLPDLSSSRRNVFQSMVRSWKRRALMDVLVMWGSSSRQRSRRMSCSLATLRGVFVICRLGFFFVVVVVCV